MSAKKCKFDIEGLRRLLIKEGVLLSWIPAIIEEVIRSPIQVDILQIYYTTRPKPDSYIIPFAYVNGVPGVFQSRHGSLVFSPWEEIEDPRSNFEKRIFATA